MLEGHCYAALSYKSEGFSETEPLSARISNG